MTYFTLCFLLVSTNHLPPSDTPTALSNISITEDVYNVLINLDTSKAMGHDGISPLYYPNVHLYCANLCTIYFA